MIGVDAAAASALAVRGEVAPPLQPSLGIIDTGAHYCAVDIGVLARLQIPPTGRTEMVSVVDHAPVAKPVYEVAMAFPNTNLPPIDMIDVIGIDMVAMQQVPVPAPIALIGRTVLAKYVLIYNGPLGLFTLASA